jgi:hypothetical protein
VCRKAFPSGALCSKFGKVIIAEIIRFQLQLRLSETPCKEKCLRTREPEPQSSIKFASSEKIHDPMRGQYWRLVTKSDRKRFLSHTSFVRTDIVHSVFRLRVALVTLIEAAHLLDSHDSSEFWRLHRPRLGRILGQREMCSASVIICGECFYVPVQRRLIEDDYMIEASAANGSITRST